MNGPQTAFHAYLTQMMTVSEIRESLEIIQQRHALNIHLILYGVWYAVAGFGKLKQEDIKQLARRIHDWHELVVEPLKQLDDLLTKQSNLPMSNQLTTSLDDEPSDIELLVEEGEAVESALLMENSLCFPNMHRKDKMRCGDACQNVFYYYKVSKIIPTLFDCDQLKKILMICFDIDHVILDHICQIYFKQVNTHNPHQLKLNLYPSPVKPASIYPPPFKTPEF